MTYSTKQTKPPINKKPTQYPVAEWRRRELENPPRQTTEEVNAEIRALPRKDR